MDNKDLCEHTRIRLIAAAVGHQQCTKTESTLIPLPGTNKFIAIGTLQAIAKVLMVEPPAEQSGALTRCAHCDDTGDVHSPTG